MAGLIHLQIIVGVNVDTVAVRFVSYSLECVSLHVTQAGVGSSVMKVRLICTFLFYLLKPFIPFSFSDLNFVT